MVHLQKRARKAAARGFTPTVRPAGPPQIMVSAAVTGRNQERGVPEAGSERAFRADAVPLRLVHRREV